MSLNRVSIMGRLTRDPDLRYTTSNVAVASLSVAVDRDHSNREDGTRETDFLDVIAWRSTAEFAAKYLAKGRMVAVDGRLQSRNWEDKNGNKRKSVEIMAERIYFADSKRPDDSGAPAGYSNNQYDNNYQSPDGCAYDSEEDSGLPF